MESHFYQIIEFNKIMRFFINLALNFFSCVFRSSFSEIDNTHALEYIFFPAMFAVFLMSVKCFPIVNKTRAPNQDDRGRIFQLVFCGMRQRLFYSLHRLSGDEHVKLFREFPKNKRMIDVPKIRNRFHQMASESSI